MKARNFMDLKVWQVGRQLVLEIYKVTRSFPKDERFGLIMQMRRAAISVPANIAEGFNRIHNKEYRHFLYISPGACAELETHVEISGGLRFLEAEAGRQILDLIDHESRMLRNLIKRL